MRSTVIVLGILTAGLCAAAHRAPRKIAAPAPFTAEDVQNATQTDPLGAAGTGPRVVRAQILLDRARFSPGEIDGHYGDNLGTAVKGYQQAHNQPLTGTIDAALWTLLNADTAPLFNTYTISAEDVAGPFNPVPSDIHEQAQMKSLGWQSAQEALGEKFHIAPK